MKHKLLFTLFTLLTCFIFSQTASADDTSWIDVSTADEFKSAIVNNTSDKVCSANIRLTKDIDLSDLAPDEAYLFRITFKGKITGKGTYQGKNVSWAFLNAKYTLFDHLDGAEFTELVFGNCTYTGRDSKSAVVANDCKNTKFDGVWFNDISAVGDQNDCDNDYMGVVVGVAENSHFYNLIFTNCQLITDGGYLALAASKATGCDFKNCTANARCDLWADGNAGNGYVGSVCGYADNCTFEQCTNFGKVTGDDDKIGGIVGYGTNGTKLTDCRNGGIVMHCRKEGFGYCKREQVANWLFVAAVGSVLAAGISYSIVGGSISARFGDYGCYIIALLAGSSLYTVNRDDGATAMIIDAFSGAVVGAVINYLVVAMPYIFLAAAAVCFATAVGLKIYGLVANADELGGIAGKLDKNSVVTQCTNAGFVQCKDNYGGGIVGNLDGASVLYCQNSGMVYGNDDVGGIAGHMNNGEIRYCVNTGSVTAATSAVGGIEGSRGGTNHISSNYYLAEQAGGDGYDIAVTQENFPSGFVAKTINDNMTDDGKTAVYKQKLGEDFYPVVNTDTTRTVVTATIENPCLEQKVYNGGQFFLAVQNTKAQISLQCDIDLSDYGFRFSSASNPFKGVIDGNGHTLANWSFEALSVNDDGSEEDPDDDQYGANSSMFPHASHAKFKNLVLSNIHITTTSDNLLSREGLLVGTSLSCTYQNITVTNSSILNQKGTSNGKLDGQQYIIGGLVGYSNHDTMSSCTTESNCTLQGSEKFGMHDTNVGGFAGEAHSSTFTLCHNAATVWANDNSDGGIVGHAYDCTFDRCLNTGHITGQRYVGGIVGNVEIGLYQETKITKCVNTGTIDDDEGDDNNHGDDYRGCIAGILRGKYSTMTYCLGFGTLKGCDSKYGGMAGAYEDDCEGTGAGCMNIYYKGGTEKCTFFVDGWNETTLTNGKYAHDTDWLYQSLDNDGFDTTYPVPISAAGTVYSNILCDGTQSYSNIYKSTGSHTATLVNGICTTCGKVSETLTALHISTVADLKDFATMINQGKDFSSATVYLDNDIDMKDVADFSPIGNQYHPYKGTFDGQLHRIKNLKISTVSQGTGFFGYVSSGTTIENLILDKTDTIASSNAHIGGIVGWGDNITLLNCGNEASVTGTDNVGGLVGTSGGATIKNCYNAGTITGTSGNATATIGYTENSKIYNTYNSGTINNYKSGYPFVYYLGGSGSTSVTNCYDINGGNGAAKVTTEDFASGAVCNNLNSYIYSLSTADRTGYSFWTQNSTAGVPNLADVAQISEKYLCFTAEETTTVRFNVMNAKKQDFSTPKLKYIKYSVEGIAEDPATYDLTISSTETYKEGAAITLQKGEKVRFYAGGDNGVNGTFSIDAGRYIYFSSTGKVAASGNIMSLLDASCSKTEVPEHAFQSLFFACAKLTAAPELPAVTMNPYCYASMFSGCTELKVTPTLPATTMAEYCYQYMFQNCSGLTVPPTLLATTLAKGCYESMFSACENLAAAPELPVTTLAEDCYKEMFTACYALTSAPELPATTLQEGCYEQMFYQCNQLVDAPELPATTLAKDCYRQMFMACSKLDKVVVEFTDWNEANTSTYQWLNSVASTGTFVCPAGLAETTGNSNIPSNWSIIHPNHLKFTAEEATEVKFTINGTIDNVPSLMYSKNDDAWQEYAFGTAVSLAANDNIKFRAESTNSTFSQDNGNFITFSSTGKVAASGSVMSLLELAGNQTTVPEYAFKNLFSSCSTLTAAPELPATTLNPYCYKYMFTGCTGLTTAPELPATTVSPSCYEGMFWGDSLLTVAPDLPATELAYSCYKYMFRRCAVLNKVNVLFTDWNSDINATHNWLEGVSDTGTFTCPEGLITTEYGASTIPVTWTVSGRSYPSVTLNSSAIATYSSAYPVCISTEGVNAYKASISDNTINLTKLDGYIPAGTGVFLYGKDMANNEVKFQVPSSAEAADVSDNAFLPTTTATESLVSVPTSGTKWVLSGDSFVKYTGTTFKENRAYLIYEPTNDGARSMTISFDDDTETGIEELRNLGTQELRDSIKCLENGRLVIIKGGRRYSASGQMIK